jgi:hypothetical protein
MEDDDVESGQHVYPRLRLVLPKVTCVPELGQNDVVAVADPPQEVASSMAVTSSTRRRANQRLGTAFCST